MAESSGKGAIFGFFGSDVGKVREAAQKKVDACVPEGGDEFALDLIDGTADHAEGALTICKQVLDAIQTLPFLGGDKVVWLKGATFLGTDGTSEAAASVEGQEMLVEIIEDGLPAGVTLVVSAYQVNKSRRFFKAVKKHGKVELAEPPDVRRDGWQDAVAADVRKSAGERGLQFTPDALELFVMMVGEHSQQISAELEKLDLSLGEGEGRKVGVEEVREVVASTRAGVVFEIGDALAKRDLPTALERIDVLLGRGESAIGIIRAAIIPRVRQLLHASLLLERHAGLPTGGYSAFQAALGKLPDSETAFLGRTKEGKVNAYGLFLSLPGARSYTPAQLRDAMEECLKADLALVTGGLEPRLLLSQLLMRLVAAK